MCPDAAIKFDQPDCGGISLQLEERYLITHIEVLSIFGLVGG